MTTTPMSTLRDTGNDVMERVAGPTAAVRDTAVEVGDAVMERAADVGEAVRHTAVGLARSLRRRPAPRRRAARRAMWWAISGLAIVMVLRAARRARCLAAPEGTVPGRRAGGAWNDGPEPPPQPMRPDPTVPDKPEVPTPPQAAWSAADRH